MAITKRVTVTVEVDVTIDETKFDAEFFRQFNSSIFDAGDDLDEHFKHLAMLHAQGLIDDDSFIEGYGPTKDMGIAFHADLVDAEMGG